MVWYLDRRYKDTKLIDGGDETGPERLKLEMFGVGSAMCNESTCLRTAAVAFEEHRN